MDNELKILQGLVRDALLKHVPLGAANAQAAKVVSDFEAAIYELEDEAESSKIED